MPDTGKMVLDLLLLLVLDIAFLGVLALLVAPLAAYKHAAFAVLKRNFVGYFSNPTGYLFLAVFVLLTSMTAFWPNAFFNNNLANLDQLNKHISLLLLFFIPAITMSIWAEERRQGTDELLLTIPAADFEIVLGKYLAAVAIFTASLLFSQISNYSVLVSLSQGQVDLGLFLSTYLGYWLMGLAMLAIGMVASFLTSNLTVGFILGALFNAPLVGAYYAEAFVPTGSGARWVAQWSLNRQFEDFGRGVISLSATLYFVLLAVVGVYLCLVLIGRRHWLGGRDGTSMAGHYLVRTAALLLIAFGANGLFAQFDKRVDVTEGRLSTLSPDTHRLVRELKPDYPIRIEAFISNELPDQYAATRFNLLTMLRELQARAGSKIQVTLHDGIEVSSDAAAHAEERYGITAQTVQVDTRGTLRDVDVVLGFAVTCGLEKVVVPFVDFGIPVEYELVRSIATVSQSERRKLGVVRIDANLFGGFTFAGGQPQSLPKQAIIEELEKQYDVEEVDPESPIDVDKYDVLLAVQPSSLSPAGLDNLIQAIEAGVPTAVFEDPVPQLIGGVPGTSQPKPPQSMFGGPPPPKGDIRRLWDALGLTMPGQLDPLSQQYQVDVVWQRYNPYEGKVDVRAISPEWVFIRDGMPAASEPLNASSAITSGLEELLFLLPGGLRKKPDSEFIFTELVTTGENSGTIKFNDLRDNIANPVDLDRARGAPAAGRRYTLAARIQSKPSSTDAAPAEDGAAQRASRDIDVIYVADIDLLGRQFVYLRARPEGGFDWRFDNVTFVLNVLDALAGDDRFLEIRKRKLRHAPLALVERRVEQSRREELERRSEFEEKAEEAISEAREEMNASWRDLQKTVDDMNQRTSRGEVISPDELQGARERLMLQQAAAERRFNAKEEKLKRDRDLAIRDIRRQLDREVRRMQNEYKLWAAGLPLLPPIIVGVVVFFRRRLREREGVSRERLR